MSEFGSYKKKELKSIKPSKFRRFWRRCAKWQKAVFISCLSLLTVVVITVGVLGGTYLSIMGKIKRDHDFNKLDNKDLGFDYNIDSNIYNIALFGIDTQNVNKFSGNSDSIMILSLNKSEHTIKLISVMRDSLVPIEKNGKTTYNKIHSAYAYGGAALAVKVGMMRQIYRFYVSYSTYETSRSLIEQVFGEDETIIKLLNECSPDRVAGEA